jgi:hypothetical protein
MIDQKKISASLHDGAPLIARTSRLEARRVELELTNGEVVMWVGPAALAVGEKLATSVKSGLISVVRVPSPAGPALDVHVGPDVSIISDDDTHPISDR